VIRRACQQVFGEGTAASASQRAFLKIARNAGTDAFGDQRFDERRHGGFTPFDTAEQIEDLVEGNPYCMRHLEACENAIAVFGISACDVGGARIANHWLVGARTTVGD